MRSLIVTIHSLVAAAFLVASVYLIAPSISGNAGMGIPGQGPGGQWVLGAFFGVFGLFVGGHAISVIRKVQRDYDWYRSRFPSHVDSRGNVRCNKCDGKRVLVRNLLRQTFTRAHICERCGRTLFYSAE